MILFKLIDTPIDTAALNQLLQADAAGACSIFEGRVRNHNNGRDVERLEYEAWSKLAHREGARIIAQAVERFGLERGFCVHRTGKLEVGDVAVWVGVSAAHRDEAFEACRYIIDRVKVEVPIWKKEHYSNGEAQWINCHRCTASTEFDDDIADRYSRQICLPEVGVDGQQRLTDSRVLVIGAGGLGSPALMYLAAAGVGLITVCDRDSLEVSNLHRQILFDTQSVGKSKTRLALRRLEALNPAVELAAVEEPLTAANIEKLFAEHDLVLDCTDNFAIRFLLNDAAVLTSTPLIAASVYQYEGQLQLYDPSDQGACLRCLWQEPPATDHLHNCATAGVLGPVAGVFGALQAMEALKFLLGFPDSLKRHMLLFDLRSYRTRLVETRPNDNCVVCSNATPLSKLHETNAAIESVEVDLTMLSPHQQREFTIVDIRDRMETDADPLNELNHINIPAELLFSQTDALDRGQQYLLFCGIGFRSRVIAGLLRQRGYENIFSQRGGITGLRTGTRP